MPLAITTVPLVGNFIYADTDTLTLTLQSVGDPNWNKPYWEATKGVFNNYLAENPVFIPANETVNASITGYRAIYMQGNWTTSTNLAVTAPYGSLTKNAGNNASWDARATSNTIGLATYDGFFSFSTNESGSEKAGGLSDNTSDGNPNSATFRYAWHLLSDGTAMVKRLGATLVANVPYSAGDVFKVHKIGATVYYYKNNTLYYSYAEDVDGLFPLVGIRTVGGTVTNTVFYNSNSGQSGTLVVPVYGVFPEQPNWSYQLNKDNNTLVSRAEDGSAIFNKKGNVKKSLSLQFVERPYTEYVLIADFWDAHEKHKNFIYKDVVFDKEYIVVFDSGLNVQPVGPDRISISLALREI